MEKSVKRNSKQSPNTAEEQDVYRNVVEFEEMEARTRDGKEDATIYLNTCTDIRRLLGDILTLKCNSVENKPAVAKKRVEACMLTSVLKKLNRLENIRLSAARDAIATEKQMVEGRYMQYQNLLYEVDHYDSEYRKCMQYISRDETIDLISTEEFFKNAPEDITSKFLEDNENNHELYLARLDFELKQRINLALLLEDLKVEKKSVKEEIINLKEKLAGLEPKLLDVVAATKPLQEYLGLNIGEINPEHKLACHLPDYLYLMYCNTDAYRQFIDKGCITIEIKGDLEEVRLYNESQKVLQDETDHEQDLQEETTGIKKHRRRKGTEVDREEEKKKNMLLKHPLSVEVTMKTEHVTLKLHFYYLPTLRIVTVVSTTESLSDVLKNSTCAQVVLTGESILNQLYPKDTGTDSPNLVNYYQLKQVGIDRFQALISQLGYAYGWAQKICGLEFLNMQNAENRFRKHARMYQHTVEECFTIIERRLRARGALAMQMYNLEQNLIPTVPAHILHPKSASSTLTKFATTSFQRFCQDALNAHTLVDKELIAEDDLFYLAVIERPKASMNAWIAIRNDYPDTVPMFVLHLKYNGDHHSENSDQIRDMERNVNGDWKTRARGKDLSGCLLAAQLKYLCAFLDVYLETNDDSVFSNSTVFFRPVSGRTRRRPFKFHKTGNGIFAQY
ncbi:THO complex subunit 5 homolog [Atheta coriaria]|uniref:THO complex subunit 5 homolog n=1 Tax=Dalotia coriaria TaxID=877792 RepID=UPI0031F46509